jgi:hypothetical protein
MMTVAASSSVLSSSIANTLSHSSTAKQNDHKPFLHALAATAASSSSSANGSNESLGLGSGLGVTAGLALTMSVIPPLMRYIATFLSYPSSSSSSSSSSPLLDMSSALVSSNLSALATSSSIVAPQLPLPSFPSYLSLLPVLSAAHFLYLAGFVSLLYLYHVVTRPLVFSRPLTASALDAALRKSYADMPPPFPNAWYKLCDDFDVARGGEEKRVLALGRELIVKRRAEDGGLECLDAEGNMWELCEANHVVFVWHDEMRRSSAWQVPVVNADMSRWKFGGRTEHQIVCHIQEIPENGADTAHLDFLHGGFILDFISAAKHTWDASWIPQPHPNTHIAKIAIDTAVSLYGYKLPVTTVQTRITQVGPAIVQLQFPTPFGSILLQETITPLHSNIQAARHVLWCEETVPSVVAKAVMKSTLIQFERDFIVWNHKRWLRAPMAVREDGPILKYRRWMKQFFDREGGELRRDMDAEEEMVERAERVTAEVF